MDQRAHPGSAALRLRGRHMQLPAALVARRAGALWHQNSGSIAMPLRRRGFASPQRIEESRISSQQAVAVPAQEALSRGRSAVPQPA